MKISIFSLCILICLFGINAYAELRLDRGELVIPFVDLSYKNYRFERVYYSRSTYRGLFGLGWCTLLDVEVSSLSINSVKVDFCGNTIQFQRNKSLNFTDERKLGTIIFQGNDSFILYWKNSRIYFNSQQQLIGMEYYDVKEQKILSLTNIKIFKKQIHYLVDNEIPVNLRLNDLGLVTQLQIDKMKAAYEYADSSLISFKDSANNNYKYEYNDKNLLTKVIYPNLKFENFYYHLNSNNWVKSFKRLDGCTESYLYNVNGDNQNSHSATVNIVCNNKTISVATHQFKNSTIRNSMSLKEFNRLNYNSFNPRDEKPEFDKSGKLLGFSFNSFPLKLEYDKHGRIVSWKNKKSLLAINYDQSGNVDSISADDIGMVKIKAINSSSSDAAASSQLFSDQNSDSLWNRYHSLISTTEKLLKNGAQLE